MISVDIKARIGEIRFKGDKSCIFIIETEGRKRITMHHYKTEHSFSWFSEGRPRDRIERQYSGL